MNIQWYPGHMAKSTRLIKEELTKVDVVVVVGDSRAVERSVNGDFLKLFKHKRLVYVFNKMTLADPKAISAYSEKLSKAGTVYFFTDAQHQKGTDALKNYLMNIKSDFRYNRPVNVMVVGIPNVGKSMLINTLAKRAANVTQNRPAVTRANKWIHVSDTFYLLDTPGILTPKFENQEDGVILACIGTVKEVAFDRETLAIRVLEFLQTNYPSLIEKRYSVKLDEDDTSLSIMDKIARKRGFIMRGNQIDYERSAATVIDEFKNGVIGKIAFDFPQSDNEQLRSNELKSD